MTTSKLPSKSGASNQTVDVSLVQNMNQDSSNDKNSKTGDDQSSKSPNKTAIKLGSPSSKTTNKSAAGGGFSSGSFTNSSSLSSYSANQGIALGMIETRGMVPAIEAADAMTKAAEVALVSREYVGGGYVTIKVRGETGAVNASVRAGADACERVGDGLIAAHIIARPHEEIEPVLVSTGAKRRY